MKVSMRKLFITTFVLLTLFGVPCAGSSNADDATVEMPFTFEKGLIILEAKIKGNVPVALTLATGAEHSRMDGGLLDKYKLPSFYNAEYPVTGRNDRLYTFSTVPDVRVGGLSGKSLNMRLYSFSEESQRVGREIFGSLGVDFLRGRVVQLDFKKKVVRFLSQSPDVAKDAMTGASATPRAVLPMRHYKETLTLPIADNVTLDGKKIKMNFDTGIITVISLSASSAKQLNLTPPQEKENPRIDKINSLRFAEHEIKGVPVLLYPKGSAFETDDKDFDAVAGIALLQNFLVTFDFRKKVIILAQL